MKKMCAKCGGATKTKMAKGGSMKTTVGSKSAESFIAGIPNGGPTGPNYQGIDTMKKGGTVKKYQDGGMTGFEKRQARKVGRAQTRAVVAGIEGEGTVAQKRDNRATRVATMAGTGRAKTPKSVSTSTSTTDNRNSGNTTNTTNSGSSSGAMGGSGGRSGSTSGVDNSKKSSTSVNQSQDNSRTNNVKNTSNTNVRQSQNNSKNTTVNQSQNNSRNSSKSTTNYTDRSNTTKIDQSRKNTQIGKGNTSTKKSNFKKGCAIKKMAKGGATSFGMLSVKAGVDKNPKPTAADRIAGAKKKAKFGASVPVQHSPAPGRVRSSSGVGTVAVGARKKMGGTIRKKK